MPAEDSSLVTARDERAGTRGTDPRTGRGTDPRNGLLAGNPCGYLVTWTCTVRCPRSHVTPRPALCVGRGQLHDEPYSLSERRGGMVVVYVFRFYCLQRLSFSPFNSGLVFGDVAVLVRVNRSFLAPMEGSEGFTSLAMASRQRGLWTLKAWTLALSSHTSE